MYGLKFVRKFLYALAAEPFNISNGFGTAHALRVVVDGFTSDFFKCREDFYRVAGGRVGGGAFEDQLKRKPAIKELVSLVTLVDVLLDGDTGHDRLLKKKAP